MRYINLLSYLLTYLLTDEGAKRPVTQHTSSHPFSFIKPRVSVTAECGELVGTRTMRVHCTRVRACVRCVQAGGDAVRRALTSLHHSASSWMLTVSPFAATTHTADVVGCCCTSPAPSLRRRRRLTSVATSWWRHRWRHNQSPTCRPRLHLATSFPLDSRSVSSSAVVRLRWGHFELQP